MQAFITMINIIIAKEIMFNILIKCFKKFRSIITMHSIDINNEINSNIINKIIIFHISNIIFIFDIWISIYIFIRFIVYVCVSNFS